ncbi:MAG: FHA domain-containing protein [Candidatus Omnitrophica bacterium]|nr:FHA domain-containing protein [Candidatus Omnitrophota bacterium]
MAKLIIEIIHPLRFLREYRTFDAPQIRIGRGYDNDLILGDPHVSPAHLVVRNEEGGWVVEDIGGENGMYVRKFSKVAERARLDSGDEIIIGRTRLRFFSPEHPVAATKLLVPAHPFFQRIEKPVNAWSILLVCAMIFTAHVYMTSIEDVSILKLASGSLGFLFAAFAWAGAWAFIGRMIQHKTQFAAQLSLVLLFLVAGLMSVNVSEYAGYSFNSVVVEIMFAAALLGVLGTAFLAGNMTLATNVSLRKRIAVCSSIFLGIIAILTLLYYSFKDEFNPNPMYFSTLKPPFAKVLPDRSIDRFLTETAGIFDFPDKIKKPAAN